MYALSVVLLLAISKGKNNKLFKYRPNPASKLMLKGDIMTTNVCSSCKKQITNIVGTADFMCPKCGKEKIVRCKECRKIAAKYKCKECGFVGPN